MWYETDDPLDEEQSPRHRGLREMLRRMLPLFRPHRGRVLLAALLLVGAVAADLSGPLLVRHLLDHDIPAGDGHGVLLRAGAYILLFAAGMALAYVQVLILWRVGLQIITGLRQQVFAHLMTLSLAYFDKNPPGRLMARVESDVEKMMMLFSDVALALLRNVILFAGTFTVMVIANARVTFAVLTLMVPLLLGTYFFLRYIRGVSRTVRRLYARISTFLVEYVQGIPILQIFSYTDRARLDLARLNNDKYGKEVRLYMVEYVFWAAFASVEVAAVMVIIYVGAPQIFAATLTVGTLVLFIEYTRRLFWPLIMFSEQLDFIQRAFASADRVFNVLDTPSRTPDRPGARERVPDDWREIAFEQVSFVYDGGVKALDRVDLRIRRGERVALVGPSGAGKSTLVNLIPRFYDVSAGAIRLDGRDIREFTLSSLRAQIGMVTQEVILFNDTVRANVCCGRAATDAALWQVLERANARLFVERLPQGLDTRIGEGGILLSGGERQRLAVARALLKNAPLLILDEATSALDTESEREVQEALEELMRERTTLVIAHRLSTVYRADRILVLEGGTVVEEGSHEKLLAAGGLYRKLYDLQFADPAQPSGEKP